MTTQYKTAFIAGAVRLTRAPSVLSPLPQTRCGRAQVNRYMHVRDSERTARVWAPGMVIVRDVTSPKFP